jgi:hypothetical protein
MPTLLKLHPEAMSENTDILTFETDRATRIRQIIISGILAFGALLMAILYPIVIGGILWALTDSRLISMVVMFICMFYFTRWVWRSVVNRCRFSIHFLPDALNIGKGISAYAFPYEEVEYISVAHFSVQASWVKIRCRNKNVQIFLSNTSLIKCVNSLRLSCKNAIYKDEMGREHLPSAADRPEKTILWLQQHYRRRAIYYTMMSLFLICMTSFMAWSVIRLWLGIEPLPDMSFAKAFRLFLIALSFTICCLWETCKLWRQARRIKLSQKPYLPNPQSLAPDP